MQSVLETCESKMQKSLESLSREFDGLRTGRASTTLLDKIRVDYYGAETPINQVATISVPEARTIVIQPWDKSVLSAIERAILKSDLGLPPNNDGKLIRLNFPPLNEERRKQLVKVVKGEGEDAKVAVRNLRRDANTHLKDLLKAKAVSEDEERRAQDEIQKLTDRVIAEIDKLLQAKEQEIMTV